MYHLQFVYLPHRASTKCKLLKTLFLSWCQTDWFLKRDKEFTPTVTVTLWCATCFNGGHCNTNETTHSRANVLQYETLLWVLVPLNSILMHSKDWFQYHSYTVSKVPDWSKIIWLRVHHGQREVTNEMKITGKHKICQKHEKISTKNKHQIYSTETYKNSQQTKSYFNLLHRWHESPVWTLISLMDFSQSALFLDLSFQFLITHLLMSVGIQPHHLFFGHPLTWLAWALLLNTWLTFLLLFILLTWPTQFNHIILTNEITFKSPNSCNSSLLYCILQFSFTLVPPNILLKIFLSKAARWLAISLFNTQTSAPYVATGLIMVF